MRLIDADKIDFGKVFIGASDLAKDTREAAQELIDKMPTAYDVDKVAYRLMCESINCHIMTDRAVVIVQSGGVVKTEERRNL